MANATEAIPRPPARGVADPLWWLVALVVRVYDAVRAPFDRRAAAVGPRPGRPGPQVLMFLDNPRGISSGRPRAVLARANTLAARGHAVTIAVERFSPRAVRDIAGLRRTGSLDRKIAVVLFSESGPGPEDLAFVESEPPLAPPVPEHDRKRVGRGRLRRPNRVQYLRGGKVVRTDRLDLALRVTRVEYPRPEGVEVWHYDDRGSLGMIETLDTVSRRPLRRSLVAAGRAVWLDMRIDGLLGDNPANLAAGGPEHSVGAVYAAWVDRLLADAERPVVFADGEAISQRTLRSLKHPGVRGVFAIHNNHFEAPFTPEQATLPWWRPYYADLTNVSVAIALTDRQMGHLRDLYPELPLRSIKYVPRARRPLFVRRRNVAVAVARLAAQKHLDELLRAFAVVAKRVPGARLDIYGTGPDRAGLEQLSRELGLARSVRFRGFTSRPMRAFAGARVACMTSRTEGLPLVLGEAMGVGTPVISYDTNYGPAEVIRDGVDGFIVEPGNVDAYADRLATALGDAATARRMSREAATVSTRFPLERFGDEWDALVRELAGEPGGAESVGP